MGHKKWNTKMINLTNKNRLTKDIVIYNSFINSETCEKLITVLDKHVEFGKMTWTPISFYESYSSVLPQDNDDIVIEQGLPPNIFSDIKQGIINAIASVHGLDPNVICQIGYHTQKWEPGAYARIHSDNTDENGVAGAFTRSRYAAFLYLNENFKGGILRFPDQKINITPQIGMLAAFDGGFNNMHEVSLIEEGVRYTIGSFWDDREEDAYPQELRDAWAKEMEEVRALQAKQKKEWQELLKEGYKIDEYGNKYEIGRAVK